MLHTSFRWLIVRLLIFLVGSPLFPVYAEAQKVSCKIPPAEGMHNAQLTCYFPEDISRTKKDIAVYHYNSDPNFLPNPVLDCLWISGKEHCLVQPGYEFNNQVSDNLTLRILNVSEKHTGRYSCQMYGSRSRDIDFCYFELERDENVTCDISVVTSSKVNLTCHFPEDVNQTKRNFAVYHDTDPDPVLDCRWPGEKMVCSVHSGYEYDSVVTDITVVQVPSSPGNQTGQYTCQLLGSKAKGIKSCFLGFDQPNSFVTQSNFESSGTEKDNKRTNEIVVIVLPLVIVLFSVLAGFIYLFCIRRRGVKCGHTEIKNCLDGKCRWSRSSVQQDTNESLTELTKTKDDSFSGTE